jgi:hypothetical protein
MRFQYMLGATKSPEISEIEQRLDQQKYHILLNGSFGDVYIFLSILVEFAEQVQHDIVIYTEARWLTLARRFSLKNMSVVELKDHRLIDLLISKNVLSSFGPIKLGEFFQSCITCHANIPELFFARKLTLLQSYQFLLNLPSTAKFRQPPERETYIKKAKTLLPPGYQDAVKKNIPKVLVSFSNNTNEELPQNLKQEIVASLKASGAYVVHNIAKPSLDSNETGDSFPAVETMEVPADCPCETLDQFDYFYSGINGLQGIALLHTQRVQIVVYTPEMVRPKSNDWCVDHAPEALSYHYQDFDTSRLKLIYI